MLKVNVIGQTILILDKMGWYLDGEIYIGAKLMQEHWHCHYRSTEPQPG